VKYLSVCAGIEAATVAWHPLGWEAVGYSEIEPFPSAVLKYHYPDITNFGDMTKFKEWNLEKPIDLLVGGTPCQSFSVAGLRKGLEDPRGNLALVYCGILDHFRPQWFVWENVPGVLSSNGGRDFGSFLGALAELGYGFAYRVLDAQYFGVAQRRRRVFVVGYLGNWRPAAEVLFERESVCGNPAPSREKRQEAASGTPNSVASGKPTFGTLSANAGTKLWLGNQEALSGDYHILQPIIAKCITTKTRHNGVEETLIPAYAIQGSMIGRNDNAGPQGDGINEEVCFTQNTTDRHAVAQPVAYNIAPGKGALKDDIHVTNAEVTKTLDASGSNPTMHQGGAAVIQPIPFGVAEKPDIGHCLRSGASKADKHESTTYVAQPMAFTQNTRDEVRYINGDGAIAGALAAQSGMKQTNYIAQPIYMGNAEGGAKEVPFLTCHNLGGTAGISNQTPLIGQPITFSGQMSVPQTDVDMSATLQAKNPMAVAQPTAFRETTDCLTAAYGTKWNGNASATNGSLFARHSMAVRRLTPVECERLQGFPDNYTNIPWRKAAESPDGPRYKALGNSMAVPVMAWIGKRIADYEQ